MERYLLVIVLFLSSFEGWSLPCVRRQFNLDSVVCVCNATYCDFLQPQRPSIFQYHLYTSDRDGKRFHLTEGRFRLFGDDENHIRNTFLNHTDAQIVSIDLEDSLRYRLAASKEAERVEGFGGTFTDSTGINYFSLSSGARNNLIRSYFSPEGISYNLCRLTIAGNDFSPRLYTYDDVPGDASLSHFSLTEEDYKYKIPMIVDANRTSAGSLHIIASAWTAPPWMKDNNQFMGKGTLKPEHFQTYANYLVKFMDRYQDKDVDIWALTTGNEPLNGLFGDWPEQFQFNSMGWTPFGVAKWVDENLGPTLKSSRYPNTKLFVLDEQKIALPWYLRLATVFDKQWMSKYIHGVAVHWYLDSMVNALDVMAQTREQYPNLQIVNTEASHGVIRGKCIVCLGLWERAENYAENIIDNMNVGMAGWIEYNLALDMTGGPLWHSIAPLDAPIIVNATADEFYKQPMFYGIGHFSKFIRRGARVVKVQKQGMVKMLVTVYKDRDVAVVFLNRSERFVILKVRHPFKGVMYINLTPRSISTLVYQKA